MKQLFEEKKIENVPLPSNNFQNFIDQEEEAPEDLPDDVNWQEDQELAGDAVEGAWTGDLDIDLPDIGPEVVVEGKGSTITVGDPCQTKWLKRRKLVADLVAAGEFDEALNALKRRLGVVNADPLEPLFKEAYWATCSSYTGFPDAPSLQIPLLAEGSGKGRDCAPIILFNSDIIVERVKEANRLTTQGRFKDALAVYRSVLQSIPLSVAADATEESKLLGMVETCREYVGAMRLETTRQSFDAQEHSARKVELSAYLACCKLQPVHLILTLRVAMTTSFKAGNFVTAASFAKRLIQGNFGSVQKPADVVTQAKKVLQVCDSKATEAFEINYDPKAPEDFKLCCGSLTPISAAEPSVQCPYCSAEYHVTYRGTVCQTCELSEVGAKTLGLQLRPI
jgi:coatomer protein complex subunit alpha (xenin)